MRTPATSPAQGTLPELPVEMWWAVADNIAHNSEATPRENLQDLRHWSITNRRNFQLVTSSPGYRRMQADSRFAHRDFKSIARYREYVRSNPVPVADADHPAGTGDASRNLMHANEKIRRLGTLTGYLAPDLINDELRRLSGPVPAAQNRVAAEEIMLSSWGANLYSLPDASRHEYANAILRVDYQPAIFHVAPRLDAFATGDADKIADKLINYIRSQETWDLFDPEFTCFNLHTLSPARRAELLNVLTNPPPPTRPNNLVPRYICALASIFTLTYADGAAELEKIAQIAGTKDTLNRWLCDAMGVAAISGCPTPLYSISNYASSAGWEQAEAINLFLQQAPTSGVQQWSPTMAMAVLGGDARTVSACAQSMMIWNFPPSVLPLLLGNIPNPDGSFDSAMNFVLESAEPGISRSLPMYGLALKHLAIPTAEKKSLLLMSWENNNGLTATIGNLLPHLVIYYWQCMQAAGLSPDDIADVLGGKLRSGEPGLTQAYEHGHRQDLLDFGRVLEGLLQNGLSPERAASLLAAEDANGQPAISIAIAAGAMHMIEAYQTVIDALPLTTALKEKLLAPLAEARMIADRPTRP